MKIGIIGVGSIGRTIIEQAAGGGIPCEISAVYDIAREGFDSLSENIRGNLKFCENFDQFLSSDMDVVIEAASQKAVEMYAQDVLNSGKSIMIMSAGALSDDLLFKSLNESAQRNNVKVYIPSGAVGGIDAMKSAKEGGIDEVELVTRKPPSSLGMDVSEQVVLYEGFAGDAVKKFPKNVNVVATISIAGVGFDRTRIKIIADPKIDKNTHEIRVKGKFGEFTSIVRNIPSPDNPKTSYLASLSAIATLRAIVENVDVGT